MSGPLKNKSSSKNKAPLKKTEITQSELSSANIEWDEQGQPFSQDFEDVYFNTDSGIDESRFVFINPSNLQSHWQQHSGSFTLVETGFGTGLNFLLTWLEWIEFQKNTSSSDNVSNHLHFISIEKFPLTQQQIKQALLLFPQLSQLTDELVDHYPLMVKGFHSLQFEGHHLTLTLIFDDVSSALTQLNGPVDAWYLDGFAPAKNPDMWQDSLYSTMAQLSRERTTIATFTSAGDVRRGLTASGFKLKKVSGFGMKREMMYGTFIQSQGPLPNKFNDLKPWIAPKEKNITNIAIIGAGIAGCTTAYALARRGIKVTIFDQHGIATQASGNPQGAMYAKLAAGEATHSDIYIQGYLQSLRWLKHHLKPGHGWDDCGLIQLANSEKEEIRQDKFIKNTHYPDELLHSINAQQASDISGISLDTGGLFFPNAGWVSPQALCQALVKHPLISVEQKHITEITRDSVDNDSWHLISAEDEGSAGNSFSHVIVACANQSQALLKDSYLPTKSIRGQLTYLDQGLSKEAAKLKTVLCGKGYIAPVNQGSFCLGASYNIKDDETAMRLKDHQKNLDYLDDFGEDFHQLKQQLIDQDCQDFSGRTGFRCTTPDYLPMVGPLIYEEVFDKQFDPIRKNLARYPKEQCQFHSGLYLNIGHGSRGLTSAPLCAELTAAYICNENFPMAKDHAEALLPARFYIREMVRNKR